MFCKQTNQYRTHVNWLIALFLLSTSFPKHTPKYNLDSINNNKNNNPQLKLKTGQTHNNHYQENIRASLRKKNTSKELANEDEPDPDVIPAQFNMSKLAVRARF